MNVAIAVRRFAQQMRKQGVDAGHVRAATVEIHRGELAKGWLGDGHMAWFVARATMDNGRTYER